MALAWLIAYCLLLFGLTHRLAHYGERVFGKHAFPLVAPLVAMGASISITVSFHGGMLFLLLSCLGISLAGGMFEKEKRTRAKRRRKKHIPGLKPVDIHAA